MFLKVCLFTYNVFCNAALRMFYRCNMAALKADVSFYGLDIYISSFYFGRFCLFFRWLSLFICSVVFPYLVFFAVVGVLLLGIPIKRYVIDRIELFKKRIASIYDCRSRSLYDKF